MSATLDPQQLRFINLVAARRFAHQEGDVPAPDVGEIDGATPQRRAAALAAALMQPGAVETAAAQTALLAVCCQLRRDGLRLIAPQGVLAGMVRGLATGRVTADEFAAWLQDRSVEE
ncbi:MAG: hypothetical protein ABR498_06155 [Candidatus Dormibacteria bacterium]